MSINILYTVTQLYNHKILIRGNIPNYGSYDPFSHFFSRCIEITGNKWYCFDLKNDENSKEKFQRVKKL